MTTHPKAKLTAAEVVEQVLEQGPCGYEYTNVLSKAQSVALVDRYAAEQTESLRAELSHVRLELEAMRVERDEALAQADAAKPGTKGRLDRSAFEAMTVGQLKELLTNAGVKAYPSPGGVSLIRSGFDGEIVSEAPGLVNALIDTLVMAADEGWFDDGGAR